MCVRCRMEGSVTSKFRSTFMSLALKDHQVFFQKEEIKFPSILFGLANTVLQIQRRNV